MGRRPGDRSLVAAASPSTATRGDDGPGARSTPAGTGCSRCRRGRQGRRLGRRARRWLRDVAPGHPGPLARQPARGGRAGPAGRRADAAGRPARQSAPSRTADRGRSAWRRPSSIRARAVWSSRSMLGDTVGDAVFGASVAVSPDRRWIAVTSGLATTVLDARTREVVERIELPPTGYVELDGSAPATGVVCCAAWAPDGSRLLLGTQGAAERRRHRGRGPRDVGGGGRRVDLTIRPEVMEFSADGRCARRGERRQRRDRGPGRAHPGGAADRGSCAATIASVRCPSPRTGGCWPPAGSSARLHVVDTRTWEPREPVPVGDGALLQIEWLRTTGPRSSPAGTGRSRCSTRSGRSCVPSPLPGAVDAGPATHLRDARPRTGTRRPQRATGGPAVPDGSRRSGCVRRARSPAAT